LGAVYKLVADGDGPKMKLSEGKMTLPGRKQVYRFTDHDVIACDDEDLVGGRPLLEPVMREGRRLTTTLALADLRDRCRRAVAALPERQRRLEPVAPYPVRLSDGLQALLAALGEGR
jgi:nicotinate phosphoribosyltransferase